jgi:hypothetical protein
MKKYIVLMMLLIFINGCGSNPTGGGGGGSGVTGSPLKVLGQYNYGGTDNDLAESISQSSNRYLVGRSCSNDDDLDGAGSHGEWDAWVLKLSDEGTKEWSKCYGGSSIEDIYSSISTSDDKLVIVGSTRSNDGDISGFHGTPGIAGNSNGWVAKISSLGALEWQNCIGGTNGDNGWTLLYSIDKTNDGGFIVCGKTDASSEGDIPVSHGGYDVLVSKLAASGNIEWTKCYGGSDADWANSIIQTKDQGYIFAGYSASDDGNATSTHGSGDVWIVKLYPSGVIEWQKSYGGKNADVANKIIQTADGGFIVAGSTWSDDGDVTKKHTSQAGYGGPNNQDDYWILKLSKEGNIEWQTCLGGERSDSAETIHQTPDGGYLVAGISNSPELIDGKTNNDLWVVKLNSSGNMEWQKNYGGDGNDYGKSLYQDAKGNYWVAGVSNSSFEASAGHGGYDYWLLKLGQE